MAVSEAYSCQDFAVMMMMMMMMFSHQLNFPEIWPMVTEQAETFLMGEKTNKYIRSRCTDVEPVLRKRNDTNELWYTISYHLQPNYTRNKSIVFTGTPDKKKKRKKKNTKKGKKGKYTEKKEKKRKNAKQTSAEGAGRVPRKQGCCLLVD